MRLQLGSTSLKTVPRAWCAANYLDPAAMLTNASAAGPYINAQPGLQYNDALAVIVGATSCLWSNSASRSSCAMLCWPTERKVPAPAIHGRIAG